MGCVLVLESEWSVEEGRESTDEGNSVEFWDVVYGGSVEQETGGTEGIVVVIDDEAQKQHSGCINLL